MTLVHLLNSFNKSLNNFLVTLTNFIEFHYATEAFVRGRLEKLESNHEIQMLPQQTSTPVEKACVTVPLGLWMFERPGELRLNHSELISQLFIEVTSLHTVCTGIQFKCVDDNLIEAKRKTLIRCTSFYCSKTDERKQCTKCEIYQ